MKKVFFIALIIFAAWQWQQGSLPGFSTAGAFDDDGNPEVLVFTFKGCGGDCNNKISEMKRRRVPFKEVVVDHNDKESENFALWTEMGKGGFPFIVSGDLRVIGTSRIELASMLGKNFGSKYLTSTENRLFKRHFNSDGSPKIIIYGADWCPYCAKLRKELKVAGMDYIEIDVDKSHEKQRISEVMGVFGYPTTWYGYSRVNGTDLDAVKKTMKASG